MTIRMRAAPLGSAIPTPVGQNDPDVEIDTDFKIALRHLRQVARRLTSVGLQQGPALDQETPIRPIKRWASSAGVAQIPKYKLYVLRE